jgi:holo-[acyl-carrier protein] synthase
MIQVGVDCEEITRFRRLLYDKNERFYKRIFTPQEIEYCVSFRDPYPRFAVRFAAKEATIKALNNIARPFYAEIEIHKNKREQPTIYIDKNKFKKIKQFVISLSLSHSDSHAVAFVIVADTRHKIDKANRILRKNIPYLRKKISR